MDSPQERAIAAITPVASANYLSKLEPFAGTPFASIVGVADSFHASNDNADPALFEAITNTEIDTAEIASQIAGLGLVMRGLEDQAAELLGTKSYFEEANNVQHNHSRDDRTLDYFNEHGIPWKMRPDQIEKLVRISEADTRDVPIVEKAKTATIIDTNGFTDSKVLYVPHDHLDHIWLFNELRNAGIMDEYGDLLDGIGFGSNSFAFSRASELFSTIGFGTRRLPYIAETYTPRLTLTHIVDIMRNSDEATARSAETATKLENTDPDTVSHTVFIIDNMGVQIADERRRWGAVKHLNDGARPMLLFDPEHLSFITDAVIHLRTEMPRHLKSQLGVARTVNGVLEDALEGVTEGVMMTNQHAPEDALVDQWLSRHPYFSAVYERIN